MLRDLRGSYCGQVYEYPYWGDEIIGAVIAGFWWITMAITAVLSIALLFESIRGIVILKTFPDNSIFQGWNILQLELSDFWYFLTSHPNLEIIFSIIMYMLALGFSMTIIMIVIRRFR